MGKLLGSNLKNNSNKSHDDGESWLISYADMVTLLMAFFVILFVLSSVEKPENLKELSKVIAMSTGRDSIRIGSQELFEMDELKKQLASIKVITNTLGLGSDIETIVEELNERILLKSKTEQLHSLVPQSKKDQLLASSVDNQLLGQKKIVLNLSSKILFGSGKNKITQAGQKKLHEIFSEIQSLGRSYRLQITGHTDSRSAAKSRFGSNWGLSAARASQVANYLEGLGLEAGKIEVRAFGRGKLLVEDHDANGKAIPENLQKNRRVELAFIFDIKESQKKSH